MGAWLVAATAGCSAYWMADPWDLSVGSSVESSAGDLACVWAVSKADSMAAPLAV